MQVRSFLYTKKSDYEEFTNYREISLSCLSGKVYFKCLEKKSPELVEPQLEDGQCGFRSESKHHGSKFHFEINLLEILRKRKKMSFCFC